MAISKVIYKSSASAQGETWMDLTADTVASGNLISPNTAHGADGQSITGSVGSGTEGTPIATKGTVSNHSVNITPSVTNTAGVISGGTHTGTQVTVTAAELESGTKSITQNGTGIDVTGYSAVDVAVPSGTAAVIDVVEQLPGGGEHHIITGVDISDTTAVASDVAQGKYFYTADGTKTAGTASSAGSADDPIPAPLKDVVFVDYDGEIVEQYTADEFLSLSSLPANPSHTGLTAQGWNWTLADAKTYVQSHGCLCIGQNYTTSDGKTRIYLDFTDQNMVGRPLYIMLCTTVKGGVTIDWGDGTSTTTTANANASGTYSHTYAAGRYTLTLECTSGTYYLGYNGSNHGIFHINGTPESDVSATAVIAMEVGNNVTVLQRQGFGGARNLRTISIPTTLTNFGDTTGNVFAGASSLKCLVFPSGTTAHYGSIASTRFLSVPKSLSVLGGLNGALRMLTLPEADWVTSRGWSLPKAEKIVIPGTYTQLGGGGTNSRCFTAALYCHKFVVPASVTTINDYALCDNQGLTEIHFLPTTVPTLENTRALGGAPTNRVIYVPYSADHSILEAYQTASNWSTFASIMEEEPQ